MDYLNKYLKYKQKYTNLKKIYGGSDNIDLEIDNDSIILNINKEIKIKKDYYLPCEISHYTKKIYFGIEAYNDFSFHNLNKESIFEDFPQDYRIILS
jgi:hypothetical protein